MTDLIKNLLLKIKVQTNSLYLIYEFNNIIYYFIFGYLTKLIMKNFKITLEDKNQVKRDYWISRSMAVSVFIFLYNTNDKSWYVLANRRGNGAADYHGLWNCPCGYLDYNETLQHAAWREVKEETNFDVNEQCLKLFGVNSNPSENRQNVTTRFYYILENDGFPIVNNYNCEPNEVSDVQWININNLDDYEFAFNHKNLILKIFYRCVNISLYKRMIRNAYERYFN